MRQVLNQLRRLQRRTRSMLITQRLAVMLAWVLGVGLAMVLADYLLRLPSSLRLMLLIVGLCAVVLGAWRYVLAARGYRPDLTELALRVERSLPSLAGRLASCVEFALTGVDERNALAARSIHETQRRLAGESVTGIIRPGPTLRSLALLIALGAVTIGLAAAYPAAAQTGLSRLLLPYGSARWPAHTAVASLMREVVSDAHVHPRGQALPLRAHNLTINGQDERVDGHYRLMRDSVFDDWRVVMLTHQGRGVHERLIDTDSEVIELYFTTEDARTAVERVELVPPPAVVRALLSVTPPPYASAQRPTMETDLGPGIDERAVTGSPSLVGSQAEIVFELNKPLPVGSDRPTWLRSTFTWGGDPLPQFSRDPEDARRWRLAWRLAGTRALLLDLVDEHGLRNREPIGYRVEAVDDRSPTVVVTKPQSDEAVLPTARVAVAGEAEDDVAVSRIGIETHAQRAGRDDSEPLAFAPQREVTAETTSIEAELDLAQFDLAEGDIVLVTIVADDFFELDGERHETVVSSARRLRLISALEFAAQLRSRLSAVRQSAIRIEAMQCELQDDVAGSGVQPGLARAQALIGDRIADQRSVIDELRRRMEVNRFADEQMSSLIEQSGELLDQAGRAAGSAIERIDLRRRDAHSPEPQGYSPEDEPIINAQQEVRDEMENLIALLDRDEDTWLIQRRLQSIIDDQVRLHQATESLAAETIGQEPEDLTEPQLTELDRIAQRQEDLRDLTRRLLDEMHRRAEALEEVDPRLAAGMRKASETGEQNQVDREMEAACRRVRRNQLQSAAGAQETALRALDRMNRDLKETKRARAEELLRELASLLQSIRRLIAAQESEIIALARSVQTDEFSGRDAAMIRLSRNTQSGADEARAAGWETKEVAQALSRAADAQGAAVTTLRAEPVDAPGAEDAEERSLALLNEARRLAEEIQQQTQADQTRQRREELIEAYRELAEWQIAIRQDTLGLLDLEQMTRRELIESRRLGGAQHELRFALIELRDSMEELLESLVFNYVHELMDQWCGEVSSALWEGAVDAFVTDQQQMIVESIARQIEALRDQTAPPEFATDRPPGGGGGRSGAEALIPPMAELKRLRGLQEQVYLQTCRIDQQESIEPARRRKRMRDLGRMQREIRALGEQMLDQFQTSPAEADGDNEASE